jgi:hypothetical protein
VDDIRDLRRESQRVALQESAIFLNRHLTKARSFGSKFELMEYSLGSIPKEAKGNYCEFGVYKGETIDFIASKTASEVHGFDSFEGLPEDWREGFDKGTFKLPGLPEVRANVRLHKGWFDASVPVWMKKYPQPVVFAHMDADLYSSTKCVLDLLAERFVPGTVLQFDEFFNYPGWQEGEYKAFTEFVATHQVDFEYLGYVYNHEQVAVRIKSVAKKSPAN